MGSCEFDGRRRKCEVWWVGEVEFCDVRRMLRIVEVVDRWGKEG